MALKKQHKLNRLSFPPKAPNQDLQSLRRNGRLKCHRGGSDKGSWVQSWVFPGLQPSCSQHRSRCPGCPCPFSGGSLRLWGECSPLVPSALCCPPRAGGAPCGCQRFRGRPLLRGAQSTPSRLSPLCSLFHLTEHVGVLRTISSSGTLC